MKSIAIAIIGWFMTVTGCVDTDGPISISVGKPTQAQVDAITVKCGASPIMAQVGDGVVWIDTKKFAPQSVCVIDALYATGEVKSDGVGVQTYYAS